MAKGRGTTRNLTPVKRKNIPAGGPMGPDFAPNWDKKMGSQQATDRIARQRNGTQVVSIGRGTATRE